MPLLPHLKTKENLADYIQREEEYFVGAPGWKLETPRVLLRGALVLLGVAGQEGEGLSNAATQDSVVAGVEARVAAVPQAEQVRVPTTESAPIYHLWGSFR